MVESRRGILKERESWRNWSQEEKEMRSASIVLKESNRDSKTVDQRDIFTGSVGDENGNWRAEEASKYISTKIRQSVGSSYTIDDDNESIRLM